MRLSIQEFACAASAPPSGSPTASTSTVRSRSIQKTISGSSEIADGTICADGAPEAALNPALIRRLYGVDAHFIRTQDGVLIAPAQNS